MKTIKSIQSASTVSAVKSIIKTTSAFGMNPKSVTRIKAAADARILELTPAKKTARTRKPASDIATPTARKPRTKKVATPELIAA